MTQPRTLLTAQEFQDLYAHKDSPRYELVKGELVEMAPPGGVHGGIAVAIGAAPYQYVRENNLGRVMVETGFRLEGDPATVRAPDVSFIKGERLSEAGLPEGFVESAPDLAVEVVSPSDVAAEVEGKVHDYLRSGAQRVWVVYSTTKRVVVYSRDGSVRWYQEGDTLADEELLPVLSVPVQELFAS